MPAEIAVVGGPDDGRRWQIEEEVVGLGRGPNCQLRVADPHAPEKAVVIRYQNGRYVVYNRSERPIIVADRPLPPGESRPWEVDAAVQAWAGATLRLVVSGDPAPARRLLGRMTDLATDPVASSGPVAEPPGEGKKKTTQLVLMAAVWLLVGGLLAFKLLNPETPEVEELPPGEEVLKKLDVARSKDPEAGEVADRLREALVAERRGLSNTAQAAYADVVIRLKKWQADGGRKKDKDADAACTAALEFALRRAVEE